MIQPVKHYAVNWVDGMKISREHFTQQENFFIDALRDTASLTVNSYNYGLLPLSDQFGNKTIYEIQSTATNDAQLVIRRCSALTLAGNRIDISDFTMNIRQLEKNMLAENGETDGEFYILASTNPFDKIPFGDIDSDEIPPRHPFTKPNYHVELVDTAILNSSYSGGNYLVLGKVAIRSGIAQIDSHFIPPCTAVESHPKLVEYHQAYSTSWGNIRQYCFKILQKNAHQNQNTVLAENVKGLCRTIIHHLGEHYFQFKNTVLGQPPVFLADIFSQMALQLYNYTQMMAPAALEEMLNYSLEWSEIAPHTILNQLAAVADINYNHQDAGNHFNNISMMLKSLEQTLGKLSELDYIGQRKENIIVNEQEIKSNSDPKKGWSVID